MRNAHVQKVRFFIISPSKNLSSRDTIPLSPRDYVCQPREKVPMVPKFVCRNGASRIFVDTFNAIYCTLYTEYL